MILHKPFLLLALFTLPALSFLPNVESTIVQLPHVPPKEPVIRAVVPQIRETSGIADSKLFPGYLWAHEDSGNPEQLHLIKHDGTVKKKVVLKGAFNRDWEEMALSGGDIFIADIGDNRQVQKNYWFYVFPEKSAEADTISQYKTIMFTYPDGSHDAEAFVVDPLSRHIYIITKRDEFSKLYKLNYPYSDSTINTLSYLGDFTFSGVVGAAISPEGHQLILKTYPELHYYSRQPWEPLEDALLKGNYQALPYQLEPQGEAVTFAQDRSGVFTLSEKSFSPGVNLYFYPLQN